MGRRTVFDKNESDISGANVYPQHMFIYKTLDKNSIYTNLQYGRTFLTNRMTNAADGVLFPILFTFS